MADDLSHADLRVLVASVVREVVGARAVPAEPAVGVRTETVRLSDDADLDAFVQRLLAGFEDPDTREDLRSGRLRFRIGGTRRATAADSPPADVRRIERGAVTERAVSAAGDVGARLVLGPRAVLTPLARDRARALGVVVEKESR